MDERVTTASQPVEDSMDLQPIDYDPIYLETIGGQKKQRVYGIARREWLFVLAVVLLVPLSQQQWMRRSSSE